MTALWMIIVPFIAWEIFSHAMSDELSHSEFEFLIVGGLASIGAFSVFWGSCMTFQAMKNHDILRIVAMIILAASWLVLIARYLKIRG